MRTVKLFTIALGAVFLVFSCKKEKGQDLRADNIQKVKEIAAKYNYPDSLLDFDNMSEEISEQDLKAFEAMFREMPDWEKNELDNEFVKATADLLTVLFDTKEQASEGAKEKINAFLLSLSNIKSAHRSESAQQKEHNGFRYPLAYYKDTYELMIEYEELFPDKEQKRFRQAYQAIYASASQLN